jgi:integrase/recombinase XerD
MNQFFKNSRIKSVNELIQMSTVELENELVNYAKHLVNRVRLNELSANTVPKQFKGIKYLLDVNYRKNDVRWKSIKVLFPTTVKLSGYKAWTAEQVQEMELYCKSTRNLAFLHFMASLGGRIGIHENQLLMKHLIPISNSTELDCCAILLYADEDESAQEKDSHELHDDVQSGDSYWAFLTPEATSYLNKYHNQRKRDGEIFTENTPIFRISYQAKFVNDNVKQFSRNGAISLMNRIFTNSSINRNKKGRRFDVQLDHGFRKRFDTIMKLQNSVNANIAEKILGHNNGLDGVYFAPTRQQCFAEFVKAIPQLTIGSTARQQNEINIQKRQIDELESERTKVHQLSTEMTIVQARNKQLEKRITDNRIVMSGLVIDKQNVSDSKGDLYQMILELRNEVNELMKSKK